MKPSITYLGHTIDKDNLYLTANKLAAIREALKHNNIGELCWAAARVLCWSLIFAGYLSNMVFIKGSEQGNFYALGRQTLFLSSADDQERPLDIILLIDDMPEPPRPTEALCEATPVLTKIILSLQLGSWPSPLQVKFTPFH